MINILIEHKEKEEFKKDIEAITKVFNVLEISDIKSYKDKFYIEIDAIRKNKILSVVEYMEIRKLVRDEFDIKIIETTIEYLPVDYEVIKDMLINGLTAYEAALMCDKLYKDFSEIKNSWKRYKDCDYRKKEWIR